MINLSYGGEFDEVDLVNHIRRSGRNYIIQGQVKCSHHEHPKPESLDCWLRQFAENPDVKQADNRVMAALVGTGQFAESRNLICPHTGRRCKGLVFVE